MDKGELFWLDRLCDPKTGAPLVRRGDRLCSLTGDEYPIVCGVPDLMPGQTALDPYTAANIDFYEQEDREQYERLWSQYVDRYARRRIRRILEGYARVTPRAGTVYLDAGCGYGYFALNLSNAPEFAEHHALDVHFAGLQTVLERAARMGGCVQAVRGSVYELPYIDDSFDLITGNGVLHHLFDPRAAAAQIARKLAPGGYGMFVEPTGMWKWAFQHHPCYPFGSWRRALNRTSGKERPKTPQPHTPPKEVDEMPTPDWVAAFRECGLSVQLRRFNVLTGFFRCWFIFYLTARHRSPFLDKLLYAGVKTTEWLDYWLFRKLNKGFLDLIVVRKS